MRTPETINTLNGLIRICRDTERLCRAWAASAKSTPVRGSLCHRSGEWGRQGDELQALVLLLGGEPATGGTLSGRVQCVAVACRAFLVGRNDAAAADGCERALQNALTFYEHALDGYLPERIRRTISLQARQISARCERVAEPSGHLAAP